MRLVIGGKDRSADLGRELERAAAEYVDPVLEGRIAREADILKLGEAAHSRGFPARHAGLLRARDCVDTLEFETPRRAGIVGGLAHGLRMSLWRLLRYQHDWLTFRHNAIHRQLTAGLESEIRERDLRIAELERRIARLEQACAKGRAVAGADWS